MANMVAVHFQRYAFVPECGARWTKRSRISSDVTFVTCSKCLDSDTRYEGKWMTIREWQALRKEAKA